MGGGGREGREKEGEERREGEGEGRGEKGRRGGRRGEGRKGRRGKLGGGGEGREGSEGEKGEEGTGKKRLCSLLPLLLFIAQLEPSFVKDLILKHKIQASFVVVGIAGLPYSGKSTLLSHILEMQHSQEEHARITLPG